MIWLVSVDSLLCVPKFVLCYAGLLFGSYEDLLFCYVYLNFWVVFVLLAVCA